MTHQELLARIAKLSITPETNVVPSELATALMAVVKLHKPSNKGHDWMPLDLCDICVEDPGDYNLAIDVDYPCPTIQAIEEQLK